MADGSQRQRLRAGRGDRESRPVAPLATCRASDSHSPTAQAVMTKMTRGEPPPATTSRRGRSRGASRPGTSSTPTTSPFTVLSGPGEVLRRVRAVLRSKTTAAAATSTPGGSRAAFLEAVVDGAIIGRSSIRHELNEHLPARRAATSATRVRPAHRRCGYATEILRQSLIIARAGRCRACPRDMRRRQRRLGGRHRVVRRRARGRHFACIDGVPVWYPSLLDRLGYATMPACAGGRAVRAAARWRTESTRCAGRGTR